MEWPKNVPVLMFCFIANEISSIHISLLYTGKRCHSEMWWNRNGFCHYCEKHWVPCTIFFTQGWHFQFTLSQSVLLCVCVKKTSMHSTIQMLLFFFILTHAYLNLLHTKSTAFLFHDFRSMLLFSFLFNYFFLLSFSFSSFASVGCVVVFGFMLSTGGMV